MQHSQKTGSHPASRPQVAALKSKVWQLGSKQHQTISLSQYLPSE